MKTSINEIRAAIAANVKYLADFTIPEKKQLETDESGQFVADEKGDLVIKSKWVDEPVPSSSRAVPGRTLTPVPDQPVGKYTQKVDPKISEQAIKKVEYVIKRYVHNVHRIPYNDILVLSVAPVKTSIYDMRVNTSAERAVYPNAYKVIVDAWKRDDWHTLVYFVSADLEEIVTASRTPLI